MKAPTRTPPASHADAAAEPRLDASRARQPDRTGVAERDGGRIAWEAYGRGDPPIAFVPPWQIVHSRVWKAQIPDFARRHLVVAWDARGNGRSDRPTDPGVLTSRARAADLGAVMDAAGIGAAVLVGLSAASGPMVVFASDHPERVLALVFVCPATNFGEPGPGYAVPFEDRLTSDSGWHKRNIHSWRRDYRGFLEFFFGEAYPEPHSTKQIEDAVSYGLDTDPESLAATVRVEGLDRPTVEAMCAAIHCPTLILQGTDERITHVSQATGLAGAIPGSRLEIVRGGGHMLNARHPVWVNLRIRAFLASLGRDPRK